MHIPLQIPEGRVGEYEIASFQQDGRAYQRLLYRGQVLMVNTPDIVSGFKDFLQRAEGRVHINGLGIGMCCQYLLSKPGLEKLTVLEYVQEIVELVAPAFGHDPRCEIFQADAFEWEPPEGERYDFVWHDVWTTYSARNLQQMAVLFAKYGPVASWQGAWGQARCEELALQQAART